MNNLPDACRPSPGLLAVLALERQDSLAGLVRLLDMLRAIEDGLDCGSGVAADQCRLLQEIGGIISLSVLVGKMFVWHMQSSSVLYPEPWRR